MKVVDEELRAYEKKYDTIQYDWDDDVPFDHYQKSAQAIYINIQEMMDRTGLFYDEIKIYIRKERLFNQVRFLFRGIDGWIDDSKIIVKPEYHELIIAIHTNARNATVDELRNCGYEVFDNIDYEEGVPPLYDIFTDEITFSSEFARWKEKSLC